MERDVGIADQPKQGNKVGQFSTQLNPTYLFTTKFLIGRLCSAWWKV